MKTNYNFISLHMSTKDSYELNKSTIFVNMVLMNVTSHIWDPGEHCVKKFDLGILNYFVHF